MEFDGSRVGFGVVDLDGFAPEDVETDGVSMEVESGVWAGLADVDVDATGVLSCEDIMGYPEGVWWEEKARQARRFVLAK